MDKDGSRGVVLFSMGLHYPSSSLSTSKGAEARVHSAFRFAEKETDSEVSLSLSSFVSPGILSMCFAPSHGPKPTGKWPLGSSWAIPSA